MRRMVAVLAVLFVLIFAAASMAATPKMRFIFKGEMAKYYLYTDTLAIRPAGTKSSPTEHAEMWVHSVTTRPYGDFYVAKKDTLYEIIPDGRRLRARQATTTFSDGSSRTQDYLSIIADFTVDLATRNHALFMSKWDNVKPGSPHEAIYEAINKAYKREKSWFKIF